MTLEDFDELGVIHVGNPSDENGDDDLNDSGAKEDVLVLRTRVDPTANDQNQRRY